MYNPELLTAYLMAGSVVATMLFTAFKIVQTSHRAPPVPARRPAPRSSARPAARPGRLAASRSG